MQASTINADFSAHSAINQQIFDQFQSIGRRLDILEKNLVKKSLDLKKIIINKSKTKQNVAVIEHTSMLQNASVTSKITFGSVEQSVPNLACLRQDMQIQQVQQRITKLAQQQIMAMDHKIKSQMGSRWLREK